MDRTQRKIGFCASSDGTRLAYASSGRGPAVLKVCMWLNDIESEPSSPLWQPWISLLSRGRQFVAHDLRGCGLSDRRVENTGVEFWVNDIEAVSNTVGLGRFVLIGLSQGCAAAIEYTARNPERVAGLILCGGYAQGLLKRPSTLAERELGEALAKMVEFGWGTDQVAFRQVFTSRFFPDISVEQNRWANEQMRMCATPEMAARLLRASYQTDVSVAAGKITCPTLVMHSKGDAAVPFDMGCALAGLIPGARFVPLESKSHLPPASEPAWAVVEHEVESFLASIGANLSGSILQWLSELSPRERQVLDYLALGWDNARIAQTLGLASKTIRNHVTHLFDKLGVNTRAEAIVLARDAGLGIKQGVNRDV